MNMNGGNGETSPTAPLPGFSQLDIILGHQAFLTFWNTTIDIIPLPSNSELNSFAQW